jgi:hypothetical protein
MSKYLTGYKVEGALLSKVYLFGVKLTHLLSRFLRWEFKIEKGFNSLY